MLKKSIIIASAALVMVSCNKDQKVSKLKNDDEKAAYAIGLSIADNFKKSDLDKNIDIDIVKQAISDKLNNKKLLFPEDSIQSFMQTYMPKLQEKIAKKNAEEGKKFLEDNKKKAGIKSTASGLQYKVEKEGTGAKPTEKDLVSVNYVLKDVKGEVIEDSKKQNQGKPVDIPLGGVVPGWKEGVQLMSKGAKYILYVPAELGYGTQGPNGNKVMVFEIELVDFKPMPAQAQQPMLPQQTRPNTAK